MRYGYESQWFGDDAIRQKVSDVAKRFLLALKRERKASKLLVTSRILVVNRPPIGVSQPPIDIHSSLLRRASDLKGLFDKTYLYI
jgi:hypothetical protein